MSKRNTPCEGKELVLGDSSGVETVCRQRVPLAPVNREFATFGSASIYLDPLAKTLLYFPASVHIIAFFVVLSVVPTFLVSMLGGAAEQRAGWCVWAGLALGLYNASLFISSEFRYLSVRKVDQVWLDVRRLFLYLSPLLLALVHPIFIFLVVFSVPFVPAAFVISCRLMKGLTEFIDMALFGLGLLPERGFRYFLVHALTAWALVVGLMLAVSSFGVLGAGVQEIAVLASFFGPLLVLSNMKDSERQVPSADVGGACRLEDPVKELKGSKLL